MRMNQKIAAVPIVEAEAPTPDQTDREAKPNPVPNASRISERAAVTKPPAKTADHETPEEFTSLLPTRGISRWLSTGKPTLPAYSIWPLQFLLLNRSMQTRITGAGFQGLLF